MDRADIRLCYEFDRYRLDASRRVISAAPANERIDVPPKVFDAALYFVERPGELIVKERLLTDLWPGAVVEENNLTQVVSHLRRALGETHRDHRFVVTVPRHGYRFVADVTRVSLVDRPAPDVPRMTVHVAPFVGFTNDPGDDPWLSGLAESIRHRVSRIPGVELLAAPSLPERRAVARPTAAGMPGYLRFRIEGSVQRAESRVRITVRLVDVPHATQLWSLMFDRTSSDLFAVEDDISRRVARALRHTLSGSNGAGAGTRNPPSSASSVARSRP